MEDHHGLGNAGNLGWWDAEPEDEGSSVKRPISEKNVGFQLLLK